jgi:dihydrofolate reductase
MKPLCLVFAMSDERVIGKGNALPWRIPEDLRHFKTVTMGHAVISGRKTYDSVGKPLPGRCKPRSTSLMKPTRNRSSSAAPKSSR